MFVLPFFLKSVLFILARGEVTQLFGSNLQEIAIAALTLEFASYLRDFEINWTRSWIVEISDNKWGNGTKCDERVAQARAFFALTAVSFPLSWKDFVFAEDLPDISSSVSKETALTENRDRIPFDVSEVDSLYLLYKERYPAGSLPYSLLWHMEWYEADTIVL